MTGTGSSGRMPPVGNGNALKADPMSRYCDGVNTPGAREIDSDDPGAPPIMLEYCRKVGAPV